MKFEPPQGLPTLRHHEEAVLYFMQQLDWEMVDQLLEPTKTYQDVPKWKFVDMLRHLFESQQNAGDSRLLIFPGKCCGRGCVNANKNGYLFVGDVTKDYFQMIVETDDENTILDMYECSFFKPVFSPQFNLGRLVFLSIMPDDELPF